DGKVYPAKAEKRPDPQSAPEEEKPPAPKRSKKPKTAAPTIITEGERRAAIADLCDSRVAGAIDIAIQSLSERGALKVEIEELFATLRRTIERKARAYFGDEGAS